AQATIICFLDFRLSSFPPHALRAPWDPHSFPTRRSSDLWVGRRSCPSSTRTWSASLWPVSSACRSSTAAATALVSSQSRVLIRRSEEHTSELQSRFDLVCRLLL